jgi:hypothetical protein
MNDKRKLISDEYYDQSGSRLNLSVLKERVRLLKGRLRDSVTFNNRKEILITTVTRNLKDETLEIIQSSLDE